MNRVYYLSSVSRRGHYLTAKHAMAVVGASLAIFAMPATKVDAAGKVTRPARSASPNKVDQTSTEGQALKDWYSAGMNKPVTPAAKSGAGSAPPLVQFHQAIDAGQKTTKSNTDIQAAQLQAEYLKLLNLDRQPTDLRQIAESITKLRKQVTDEPDVAMLRFKIGTYLYLLGDLEAAANELRSAANLESNNALFHAQLAKVLSRGGDHHEALNQFRKSVELAPKTDAVHFLFGECLLLGGNVSESINEYRRALAIKQDPETFSGLSEALLMAGDVQGSMKAARQGVSLDPSLARAQIALTNALLRNGDAQSALRTARQAALLNPGMPESHLALGRCMFTRGDITGAVEEFKQAVGLDPLSFQAHNDLGYALYRKGDINGAIAEFRLALRINPRLTEARNNLEVAVHRLHSEDKR